MGVYIKYTVKVVKLKDKEWSDIIAIPSCIKEMQ
jgi:hypothetical protein